MNKQKNNKNQQGMNQSQSGVASAGTTNTNQQSMSAKKQASKAEYGTLTAKDDANKDYE